MKAISLHGRLTAAILICAVLSTACGAAPAAPATPALQSSPTATILPAHITNPNTGWVAASPEQQGMDSGKLADMLEYIQKEAVPLHSLLVVRNGQAVLEVYYPPYSVETRHTVQSNTKTVIALLTGIAIAQGKLEGVDQKLVDFFPERTISNLDEHKKAITLRHLLNMTAGLDCVDGTPGGEDLFTAQNWVQYLLDRPMTGAPGEKWAYCSGEPHLLSAVLQSVVGQDMRSYANQVLFQPLGIPEVEAKDWGTDPQGITAGVAGLFLTPRELSLIGQLLLNQGRWEGRQVAPADWVADTIQNSVSTEADAYMAAKHRRFGYMLSVFPDQGYYGYLGRAGQEFFVLPEKNLVVVMTAGGKVGDEPALMKLLDDFIIPAMVADAPIDPNSGSTERLQAGLKAAAGGSQPVAPLPAIAGQISGKTYHLAHNNLGWEAMTFIFTPGASEAVLVMPNTPDLKIGLDGVYRINPAPNSLPVGLKGSWHENMFSIDYVVVGDFIHTLADITFQNDSMTISLAFLNFGGPATVVQGTQQP